MPVKNRPPRQASSWAAIASRTFLSLPIQRKRPHQLGQSEVHRALSTHDCLDDFRRQQSQPQNATDIGPIDFFRGSNLRDCRVRAVLKHFAPAESAGDGFDHGVVDVAADGRRGHVLAVGREDQLSSAAPGAPSTCSRSVIDFDMLPRCRLCRECMGANLSVPAGAHHRAVDRSRRGENEPRSAAGLPQIWSASRWPCSTRRVNNS
jgi:hypothetical protein